MPELVMLGFPCEALFRTRSSGLVYYACRPTPATVATMFYNGPDLHIEVGYSTDISIHDATDIIRRPIVTNDRGTPHIEVPDALTAYCLIQHYCGVTS